jgi:hypothetical protein
MQVKPALHKNEGLGSLLSTAVKHNPMTCKLPVCLGMLS